MENFSLLSFYKFLEIKHDADLILRNKFKLTSLDLKLLEIRAINNFQNKDLKISDVMMMFDIASTSTIHKSITKLLDKKIIHLIVKNDLRIKYLHLSLMGIQYFDYLGMKLSKYQYSENHQSN